MRYTPQPEPPYIQPQPPRRKRRRWPWIVVGVPVGLLFLMAALGAALSSGAAPSSATKAAAHVAAAKPSTTGATTTTSVAPSKAVKTTAAPSTAPPTTAAPTTSTTLGLPILTYKISAAPGADITYSDVRDGTIQSVTAGDWVHSYRVKPSLLGHLAQLSVQNGVNAIESNPNAKVSCTIVYKGKVVDTHFTTGYNIADCQYSIPGSY